MNSNKKIHKHHKTQQPLENPQPFWKTKKLEEMTQEEWESLCDGCAKCCLVKVQYADSDIVYYTDLACNLLDIKACRCSDYEHRSELEPSCAVLTPQKAHDFEWLPKTCAYRLITEGKELKRWHHLVCGDPERVHTAGISIRNKAIHERDIDPEDLEDHIGKYDEKIRVSPLPKIR